MHKPTKKAEKVCNCKIGPFAYDHVFPPKKQVRQRKEKCDYCGRKSHEQACKPYIDAMAGIEVPHLRKVHTHNFQCIECGSDPEEKKECDFITKGFVVGLVATYVFSLLACVVYSMK